MSEYTPQDLLDNLNYLDETKKQIKQAIVDKGQPISDTDSFRSYVDKIDKISTLASPNLNCILNIQVEEFKL